MKLSITKPTFTKREYELISKPLDTGWVVQGPYVQQFEEHIAEFTGAKYAIAVSSCTSGQFIMSRIVDLKAGDEVIVPSFTWISTVNSIEYLGATAVFCDIDLSTFNIDVTKVESLITPITKAIYPVSLFGYPANMPELQKIATRYGLKLVEDCACGLGARINGKHCGTYDLGGILSFHPRKSITTGEGGMILTNDENVAILARSLRDHGAMKTDFDRHHQKGSFLLTEYANLGFNMRLTDLQGALGVAQSEKIPWIIEQKQKFAKLYNDFIEENIPWLERPHYDDSVFHGYQSYVTLFKPEETRDAVAKRDYEKVTNLNKERDELMFHLEENGIITRQGTHAVHVQTLYREKYSLKPMDVPASYAADKLTIALPFYPTMKDEEMTYLFDQLKKVKID